MKKKTLLVLTSAGSLTMGVLAMFLVPKINESAKANPPTYTISLDSSVNLVEKDKGYLHQASVKNNKFDVIGYGANAEGFCTIAKQSHDLVTHSGVESDAYTFEGMIYNRSVINGFTSLTVTFGEGTLYYKLTDFLMEDMDFDTETHTLTNGVPVEVQNGEAYFVVFNKSTTPVAIESLDIEYQCNGDIDAEMLFNKNTSLGGARSVSKRFTKEDSFIELENNPTLYTNNHSTGNDISTDHDNSWYRWNGKYFTRSANLGTDFRFGMTIIGNISQVLDETDYFHFNVWPQFSYGATKWDEKKKEYVPFDEQWIQTYIGNDNYEPLGKDHAPYPDDYTDYTYTGRFYGNYDSYDENWNVDYTLGDPGWKFADPDHVDIAGGGKTLREAYEEYPLPFWYLEFHVYLDEDNDPKCDISINGRLIYSEWIFYYYDTVNKPSIYITTFPMHLINYGQDNSRNPRDSYVGSFTYPRLITE